METEKTFETRVGPFALMFIGRVLLPWAGRPENADPDEAELSEEVRWAFYLDRRDEETQEDLAVVVGVKELSRGVFRVLIRDHNTLAREDDDPWWQRTEELAQDYIDLVRDYERALQVDSQWT